MDINLTIRHLDRRSDLLDFARRRAAFVFSRFRHLVRDVDIRVSDVNGPRGGIGINCLARLRLADGTDLLVDGPASSPEAGIAQVLARLGARLRRSLSRYHDHR